MPTVYRFAYDAAEQLIAATLLTTDPTPTVLQRFGYACDAAGNRTEEQIDDSLTTASHNSRNQLTSRTVGGALRFRGTVDEPATVTIQGKPASVDATNVFTGTRRCQPGRPRSSWRPLMGAGIKRPRRMRWTMRDRARL